MRESRFVLETPGVPVHLLRPLLVAHSNKILENCVIELFAYFLRPYTGLDGS